MTPKQVAVLAKEKNQTLNILSKNFNVGCNRDAVTEVIKLYHVQKWTLITGEVGAVMALCGFVNITLLIIGSLIFVISLGLIIYIPNSKKFSHGKEFCEAITLVERMFTIGSLTERSSQVSGRWYIGTVQALSELKSRIESSLRDESRKIDKIQQISWEGKTASEMRKVFIGKLNLLNPLIGISNRSGYYFENHD
jgi:hypothetical protein